MYKKIMADMDKTTLLRMREGGMSNAAIAASVGCSKSTIYRLIGAQPPEISKLGYASRRKENREKTSEGGYTVERKMKSFMHREEQEPAKAVFVMKPVKMPIPLHGEYMDYVISADRDLIDVDTSAGRTLIQIPAEKLETFIAELTAISRNIGAEKPMQFWG